MKRGNDNVQDFSAGLGFLWTHLDGMVDFAGYHKAMVGSESPTPAMLKGLPSYAWDHDRVYWKESRPSRRYRLARQAPHELLGRLTGDSVDSDMRWRNVIRLSELPWLRGHAFQGQALFPTSAYLAMAFQAAKEIAGDRIITTIEVTDFSIPRGLALQDGNSGYESIFSVSQENIGASADVFRGRFVCTTSSNDPSGTMELRCSGSLSIEFGEGSPEILPSSAYTLPNLTAIEPDEYYDSLLAIGLDYQGPFRGIKSISRALGYGVAKATWKASDVGSGSDYMIHPGPLDVAFHTIMAGVSSPLSEALYAPFLPVGIKKLILNPSVSYRYHDDRTGHSDGDEMGLDIVTCITNKDQTSFEGEVTILGTDERPMLQMEGFLLKRVRDSKPSDDRTLFSKTIWQRDILSSDNNLVPIVPIDPALIVAINRTSLYYLNQVFANLSEDDVKKPFHLNFLSASKHYLSMIQRGGMPGIDPKWLHDSKETIDIYKTQYSGQADLELIHVVGKNLLDVITGDLQLLELMLQDDRWTNLYLEGRAFEPLNNAIGDLVANISHRYPRMKILEIGAGTGGTTSFVLDRVGNAYGTYTFTDVSAGFFSNAKSKFGTHAAQLKFEVLDIEKDPLQQGFQEGSYDIIVAAAVLHATRDIRQTLTHARTLLKPGGWLIMSEHTCDSLDMLLIMGGLPGWWLGMDDGRTLSPGIKLEAWEQCLLETGFSGVDKHVSDVPDPLCHSFSVIVSQAIDDRITRIRDPLSYIDEMPLEEHLLIIGGMSLSTSRMAKAIERLALRFSDKVTLVKSLDEVPENQQERSMSVVCLADLEYSTVSETISSTRLSKLQWIFSNATNVLWLTSGRESEKPFANLFVGMARAIANELPQLKIQWLDVDAADSSLDARLIMDMFLKLKLANSPEFREGPLLYSIEPEIIIRDNYLVIPRQRVDQARNDRLNSDRRTISSQVSLRATTLQLVYSGATLSLEDLTPWRTPGLTKNNGSPSIFVDHSISIPYSGLQQYFLSLGRVVDGTESFMSISDRNCSRMYREQAFQPCDLDTAPKTDVLRAVSGSVGALFLKTFIERFAPPGGTLIHGCLPDVARALLSIAPNLKIYFGWEKDTIEGPQHFRIHRRATTHALRRSLPADIRSVLFLSDETNNSVQDQLSSIYTTLDLSAASSPMLSNKEIRRWIETSLARTSLPALLGPVVRVQDITALSLGQVLFPTVVDWTDHEALARTSIRSLRGSSLLSGDKTYLMVGLTSELGISICKWMVENGARHIILTSRSAQVNDSALAEMRALGAMIYVRKMDVTDMKSVQGLRDDISAQLPPVGGICNGALILRDALFVEMQADHINDVLAPKVAGTIHLSEVFKESPLDFFISFSSISSVQGNPGQCGYNAASLFQTAFTNQRRSRGLPASVITLGIIPELGYIAKRGRAFLEKLKPEFYLMMSETDVHQAFAESIAASAIDAPDEDAEVVAGIRLFNYNSKTERQPFWFSNPRLSHFVREEADISSEVGGNDSDATKVAILVDAAENEEEAQALITLAFASKLEAMLQMLPGSLNTEISLLDTGIDSLLAVEIRGWFLKELQVDVPVLKSLGGESAVAICADVTKQYLSTKIRARASEQDAARSGQSPQASEKANTAESSRAGTNSSSASQNGSTGESIVTGITTPPISEDGASETPQVKVSSDVGRTEALSFAQSR
jgi:aspyridone synthetase (hybrid polyketide synthase/nonribosomal peptide synthetase)